MSEFVQRTRWMSLAGSVLVLVSIFGILTIGSLAMVIMFAGLTLVAVDSMILT